MTTALLALLLHAAPLLPAEPIHVAADRMAYGQGFARATGHVTVTGPGFILHAPALTEDTTRRRLDIEGPLFAVDGQNLLLARRGTVDLDRATVELFQIHLFQKELVSAEELAAARTAAEAQKLGANRILVTADHLVRLGPGRYRLTGVELTSCKCTGEGRCTPAWSMASRRADVEAGQGAWLAWPAFRIADAGLPLLRPPALYLPLADRRTGFLLPHFAWQVQNGAILDEPFFLTLGPSYDLTLSAGYVTGQQELIPASSAAGAPLVPGGIGIGGVHGPRASAEFRYAPAPDLVGRLFGSVLDDENHDWIATPSGKYQGYVRGPRASLHYYQVQGDEGRFGDRLDLSLVSDARLTSQLTTDILFASIPATRSAALGFWRGDDLLLSADAVYYQDFQGYFSPENVHQELFGPGAPATLATAPRLEANVPDRRLGPFWLSVSSEATHEGALGQPYDRITEGPLPFTSPDLALAPFSPWQPGRAPADRLDVVPALRWPVDLGRFATASLQASFREDLWSFEDDTQPGGTSLGQSGQRGYPILDGELGTRLSRTWESGWSHVIEPELLVRAIPSIEASGLVPPLWMAPSNGFVFDHATGLPIATFLPLPYDEIDFAPGYGATPATGAPGMLVRGVLPEGFAQAELHVDQRLRGPGFSGRLDFGEYVDLLGPEGTFGLIKSTFGPFHANAYALIANRTLPCPNCNAGESEFRRLEEASGDAGWGDTRGDNVSVSFARALAAGSLRLDSPLDALFAPPLPAGDPLWALPDLTQVMAAGTAQIADGFAVHGGVTYLFASGAPIQILAGTGWKSSQGCLALDANLVFQPFFQPAVSGQPPTAPTFGLAAFFVTFDLGELGGGSL